jgi:hypothetical protein
MKLITPLIILGLLALNLFAQVKPEDTDSDGYLNISTLEHLKWLSENKSGWSYNYELDNDIDARDTKNWNLGKWSHSEEDTPLGFIPIGNENVHFSGCFNGNGFSISHIYIRDRRSIWIDDEVKNMYRGFFGWVESDTAVIENLTLDSLSITGSALVGGLIGYNKGAGINNCHTNGFVYAVGLGLTSSKIANGTTAAVIGGLIGENYGDMANSSSSVSIDGGANYTGGLIGDNYGDISKCEFTGSIDGGDESGGIAGISEGKIAKF